MERHQRKRGKDRSAMQRKEGAVWNGGRKEGGRLDPVTGSRNMNMKERRATAGGGGADYGQSATGRRDRAIER